MEKVNLTKKAAETLRIDHPRKIRKAQVQSILSMLEAGEHFDSCIVVNGSGVHLSIIDGQHRILALRKYFSRHPEEKTQVYFAKYNRLTQDEERRVYRKWNSAIRQTTDDFLNSYKDTIPMFERLTAELPLRVYGTPSKMKIRDLINAYGAADEKPYKGGEKKGTYDFVKYMQKLKDADVDIMKENFVFLQEIFNEAKVKDFYKLSAFKNVVFRALYYLVANNAENIGKAYIKRRMQSVLVNRVILDKYRRHYGRRASVDAYLDFKRLLNDCKSEKKFV